HSQQAPTGQSSAREVVAMATCDAARILKWEKVLGTIEAGKRADLLVIDGTAAGGYDALLRATETARRLGMVNGTALSGAPALMQPLAPSDQTVRVGGQIRRLFLRQ